MYVSIGEYTTVTDSRKTTSPKPQLYALCCRNRNKVGSTDGFKFQGELFLSIENFRNKSVILRGRKYMVNLIFASTGGDQEENMVCACSSTHYKIN